MTRPAGSRRQFPALERQIKPAFPISAGAFPAALRLLR